MADTKSYFEAILGSSTEGLKTRFKQTPHTEAEWAEITTVPYKGELCFTTDNHLYKLGDGEHTWSELDYPTFVSSNQNLDIGKNNILSATNTLFKSINYNLDGTLADGYSYGINQDGLGSFSSVKIASTSRDISDLDNYELISKNVLLNSNLTFKGDIAFNSNTYFLKNPKMTGALTSGSIDNLILTNDDSSSGVLTSRYQVDSLVKDSIKTIFNEDNNVASASMKAIANQIKDNSSGNSIADSALKKGTSDSIKGLENVYTSNNSYYIDFGSNDSLLDGFFLKDILDSSKSSIILNRAGQIGCKAIQATDYISLNGKNILTKEENLFYLVAAVNGNSAIQYGIADFEKIADNTQSNNDYYSSPEEYVKKANQIFNNNQSMDEDSDPGKNRDITFFNYLKNLPQGSIVYFAPGEYNITTIDDSQSVYFPSNLTYKGFGKSTFIKNFILETNSIAENIKIIDMEIENIKIDGSCENIKIQDCYNISLNIKDGQFNKFYLIGNTYSLSKNAITASGTGSLELIVGESFGTINISLPDTFTKKVVTYGLENEINYI